MIKNVKFLLLLITLLAAFLRFYQLGDIAPSLSWDEVAWGYNAYSLGTDGRDEFGVFLPYTFIESFGDFKPPLYAYLGVLPIKLFGLTALAVRFPSALFGVLTVLLTYFLVREMFYQTKNKHIDSFALCAAFLLAISPWHIMLSRAAFEANVASFFIVAGLVCFLRGVRKSPWLLVLSAVSFALTFYIFNTPRIVVPILGAVLVFTHIRVLWKYKKQSIIAAVVGGIIVLPLIPFLLSPQAKLRFQEVNIFTDSRVVEESNQKIANDHGAWWSKILDNRRVGYAHLFFEHYLHHADPKFLFMTGDKNPRFSTQDVGELYLVELPFLIIGGLFLFRRREGSWWILPVWIAIGIIPAATARETPHALRIETILPSVQIIVAYGIFVILKRFKNVSFLKPALLAALFLNFFYFLHGYYTHYAREYSQEWQYGYEQAVAYTESVKHTYKTIHMTSELGRPYVYVLWYGHITPQDFRQQSRVNRDAFGFVTVQQVGQYQFAKDFDNTQAPGELFVNVPSQVPTHAKVLKTFRLLNGEPTLVAYEL